MNRLNGYELLASGATFAPPIVNEVIVNLTGKGVINDPINGHFVGIDKDSRGYYRVVVGNMRRFKKLANAKKWLTRLVPDWELREKDDIVTVAEKSEVKTFSIKFPSSFQDEFGDFGKKKGGNDGIQYPHYEDEDEEDFLWLDRS